MTVLNYTQHVKNHIKPALGAIKLEALNTHEIQSFYNDLQKPHGDKAGLSAKTIKCVNGVLHKALQSVICVSILPMPASCLVWSVRRSSRWTVRQSRFL